MPDLLDDPRWNAPGLEWQFETVAVCKEGDDAYTVYGSTTWGFTVDALGRVTSTKREFHDVPTANFQAAVDKWNEQANDVQDDVPGTVGNSKNQQPLPEKFKSFTNHS